MPVPSNRAWAYDNDGTELLTIQGDASQTFNGFSRSGRIRNQHIVVVFANEENVFFLEGSELEFSWRHESS